MLDGFSFYNKSSTSILHIGVIYVKPFKYNLQLENLFFVYLYLMTDVINKTLAHLYAKAY